MMQCSGSPYVIRRFDTKLKVQAFGFRLFTRTSFFLVTFGFISCSSAFDDLFLTATKAKY